MQTPKGFISDDLLEVIQTEEVINKLSEKKTPQDCYDVVKDKIDLSFEEFTTQMTIINTYIEEKKSGLLSEEDLDAIAGGKMTGGEIAGITAIGAFWGGMITFIAASAAT